MTARSYGKFARYYDAIYHDVVNYKEDCDYLESLFDRVMRRRPRAILDLGCGTGNHAIELARRGYEVVGVDISRPQLAVAREKVRGKRLSVTFVQGDMARLALRRQFDAAICMFGGYGHLLSGRDARSHLASVRDQLATDGVYVFEYWHEPAAYDIHLSYIHRPGPTEIIRLDESRTDRRRHLLTMTFRFFILRGNRVVDRFEEVLAARLYTIPEMRRLIAATGFTLEAMHGGTGTKKTTREPTKATFRITAVVRPAGSAATSGRWARTSPRSGRRTGRAAG